MKFTTRRHWLASAWQAARQRPNILWITCEDLSPVLGCYGDRQARTPNLDRLARESIRYERAYATAPVCSPARSCLITGRYAHSMGSMNLRGLIDLPAGVRCFPEMLRGAGYYTSNNVKEDYNFEAPAGCWDESSATAHWRKRRAGQPFFSVFNIMGTHQGQMRYGREELAKRTQALPPELRQDPARVEVPPYFPDTPAVREQLAALATQVTLMDRRVGEILGELEADGLARETVVFFFSDHGTGLPRGKRFLHESGLRVPLLVRQPGARAGQTRRLVSFVDFAPTVLSLAGLPPAEGMQGQAFLGGQAKAARRYVYGARDRVDEEIEMSRAVNDGQYLYIRNYMPHRPVLQHGAYSEVAAVWKELRRAERGEAGMNLRDPLLLAKQKPVEELYDLQRDPWQQKNLAGEARLAKRQRALEQAMQRWMVEVRDKGLWPEAEMRRRILGPEPDEGEMRGVSAAANGEARAGSGHVAERYWSATQLLAGKYDEETARQLSRDPSASVRIAAAEALCRNGQAEAGFRVLNEALKSMDACEQLAAVSAVYYLGAPPRYLLDTLRKAMEDKHEPTYQFTYFRWAAEKLLGLPSTASG
ncbi:MAG: sulfatase [Bryobacter sp.]|nr:sulfatase [Bryobacter sp.]